MRDSVLQRTLVLDVDGCSREKVKKDFFFKIGLASRRARGGSNPPPGGMDDSPG